MALLKLARQLGLAHTFYVDGDGAGATSKKPEILAQLYDYVICIDFESTCWETSAPPQWREPEIIEFPAVLMNLKTGKVEAVFQKYVMPIESPRLSAYCTNLTGITQQNVDNGIPLQTALLIFTEWLRQELRARNLVLPKMSKDNKMGNVAIVTWSDWDLGVCLAKECQRKRLKKQPFFDQWIDIKHIYRELYSYKPPTFSAALRHLCLEFDGRENCGLDDAQNLAKLTYRIIQDGGYLGITKDLTPFQMNPCIGF